MRCNNCKEHIAHCDKCGNPLRQGEQIICYPVPGTAGRMHKHFCSMAHLTDWIREETKSQAVITTAVDQEKYHPKVNSMEKHTETEWDINKRIEELTHMYDIDSDSFDETAWNREMNELLKKRRELLEKKEEQ